MCSAAVSGDFGGAMPQEDYVQSTGQSVARAPRNCGCSFTSLNLKTEHTCTHARSSVPAAIKGGQGDGIGAWTEDRHTLPFSIFTGFFMKGGKGTESNRPDNCNLFNQELHRPGWLILPNEEYTVVCISIK